MSRKLWSIGEVDALKKYVKENLPITEICKLFAYRTQESIRYKIRSIKSSFHQEEAEEEILRDWIEELKQLGPIRPVYPDHHFGPNNDNTRKELEICIMDPHFGMQTYHPDGDHPWDIEIAHNTCLWAVNNLLERAMAFGPFERIIFPFGNDFLHADNILHTTTKGTLQPDMMSWHEVYKRGKNLAITMVETMRSIAPVTIYQIPGNHSLHSDYTMGLLLDAYFHNDQGITVDCSSSPYKFHRFGENLIGYEHGNAVSSNRLASLMANIAHSDWSQTSFREWHLGDQHRKATSIPSTFEEQGVSVEYLPGLTPPNYWHKVHGYNFQKRGAVAFIWDYYSGQEAKLMCHMNPYTGKPMNSSN